MDHIGKRQKETHPRQKANIISIITFFFTFKLFRKGTKRELEENDLYEVLKSHTSKKLGDKFESEWSKQLQSKNKNSVLRLIWACFGKEVLFLGVLQLAVKVFMIVFQPHALSKIISYFNVNQQEMTKQDLYVWASLLVLVQLLEVTFAHNYYLAMHVLGIRIRTAFGSFIYRKALKLSPERLGDISIGKIITLITKDVQVLEHFSYLFNDVWIAFVKGAVAGYVIYRKVNVATFAGVGFFMLVLPLQFYMGTCTARLRTKMCKKVDERLQLTQETLSTIKIIKMYTWENFFYNKILEARQMEINKMHWIFYLKFIILQIGLLTSNIAFYLLITTYKWLGNPLTPELVYYIDNSFHILSHTLAVRFPQAISQIAEVNASIKRLSNVLKALEVTKTQQDIDLVIKPKISLKNVDVGFKNTQILYDINLSIDMGITLITGPVGSGKSFLLKTMLKEFEPSSGTVTTQGRISYASQEPWLFPSSIKQNILFGEKYDKARYDEVVRVCALLYDFQLLTDGDNTIVEDRGNNLSKGQQARINLARAVYKDSEIYLLDDCLSALDTQVSEFIFKECILKVLQNKLVIFVSHNVNHIKGVDNIVIMRNGSITSHVKSNEISEKHLLEIVDEKKEMDNDTTCDEDVETNEESTLLTDATKEKKVYQEVKKKGEVKSYVYKKYLHFGGGILALLVVIAFYATSQFVHSYADKLMSKWVNAEQKIANLTLQNSTNSTDTLIENSDHIFKLYSVMIILTGVFGLTKSFAFYAVIKRASINLHKEMISHMIHAVMRFFDMNFVGNILNRFSKDLTMVDEYLPFIYHQVLRSSFVIVGIMTVIATVNSFFLIPAVIFMGMLMLIRRYYLKTARSLKRLDATTRSPVVGHFNATLEGLTTIRAFKANEILTDEFNRHQDLYTSASYIFASSMRAFAYLLDMLCTIFIATVIGRFVFSDNSLMAGTVGLAISQALKMTGTLQWTVRVWAELENSMTSVERILEYTEVQQETKQGQTIPEWPTEGSIKYENVYLSYTNSEDYVLKNINFTVNPKEKIGIVGRTGAGKTSIISTLFRLYEVEGRITIDGVDIKILSLDCLRKHVSIIPQDPVLFTGTIRDNIDPTGSYSDEEIWKAIESAYLTKLIPSLDHAVAEGGTSFSVGQRQLICLVRAIVRNNKIVILDEATANMDQEMDCLIHKTIQSCFKSCTVLTIAHKLHSIMDCDKVVVMERGEIVECDDPKSLLENKDGLFYEMVKRSGFRSENC